MFNSFIYAQYNNMKDYFLLIYGVLFLFNIINVSSYNESLLIKDILWYFFSLFLYFVLLRINKKYIYKSINILYILCNGLLLYLLLFGNSINGTKAWIDFKLFMFQPSELMKVVLIFMLCLNINTKSIFLFLLTLIPSILTILEPDTGNVIFYILEFFIVMLYKNKKEVKRLLYIGLFLVLLFLIVYFANKSLLVNLFGSNIVYRLDRLTNIFDNYQINKALLAIGCSGLFGKYIVKIPEGSTDFAFASLIENTGLFGSLIFLLIYNVYFLLVYKKIEQKISYEKVICSIFLVITFVQVYIHILMNIGLFPITGIPLPLLSYGGTNTLLFVAFNAFIFNNKDYSLDNT